MSTLPPHYPHQFRPTVGLSAVTVHRSARERQDAGGQEGEHLDQLEGDVGGPAVTGGAGHRPRPGRARYSFHISCCINHPKARPWPPPPPPLLPHPPRPTAVDRRLTGKETVVGPREGLNRIKAQAAKGPVTLLTATKDLDLSQAAVLADLLRQTP